MGFSSMVCVWCLMDDSEDIMYEHFILLKGCSRGYFTNGNIKQVRRTHAKLLHNIYGDLSYLWKVDPTHERIIEAGYFAASYMETWYKIGLSVTPKAHIVEHHDLY